MNSQLYRIVLILYDLLHQYIFMAQVIQIIYNATANLKI
jgi:hypothetical protein